MLRLPDFKTVGTWRCTGRLYPPRKYSSYSFLLEAESTPGPQCDRKDYVNEKFSVTPSGIEPATFRFVAQCLNQLRHRVTLEGIGQCQIIAGLPWGKNSGTEHRRLVRSQSRSGRFGEDVKPIPLSVCIWNLDWPVRSMVIIVTML